MTEAEKRFILEEAEIKPNKIAGKAAVITSLVMLSVLLLNEFGAFRVNDTLMRVSCVLGLAVNGIAWIFGRMPSTREKTYVKYVYMSAAFSVTLIVTALMNFHTTLCLFLPILLATLYKSVRLARTATVGSMVITFVAPVLSFNAGIWDTLFLQVLLQLCGFDSAPALTPFFSAANSTGQIILYMVLPREMMILLFGFVATGIVKNAHDALNDRIELMRAAKRERDMQFGVLDGLAAIIDSRDGSTGMHVLNTKHYTEMMMTYALEHHIMPDRITPEFAEMVINASPLHDIGKISIPDAVLNKPSRFTDEEYKIMKSHPTEGDRVIRRIFSAAPNREFAAVLQDVVYYHHENVDGTGYPNGVKGDAIPLAGRIVAITDAFDAMTANRVYRKGMTPDAAVTQIMADAGHRYDPELVRLFVNAYRARVAEGESVIPAEDAAML